jgi:hypothetical protein
MTFEAGTRLGTYEIIELIGAGGMGTVYRARDTKLGRDVAIKVLPETFSKDQGRLARFEREARLLASLNHPNIATLFDLEEQEGVHYLAMASISKWRRAGALDFAGSQPRRAEPPLARVLARWQGPALLHYHGGCKYKC